MSVIDLTIGHARRQQRLDGTEQGDGQRRRNQLAEIVNRHRWHAERRQLLRNTTKTTADGIDRQLEQPGHQRPDHQHRQRPRRPAQQGKLLRQAVIGQEKDQAGQRQPDRRQVRRMGVRRQHLDAFEKLRRHLIDLQTKEILDLGQEDHHRNAIGEANHHRHRNEADQLPQPGQPHRQQQHPGQQGGAKQIDKAVGDDNAVNDRNERPGRPANLHPRTSEQRNQKTGNDAGPDPCCRRHTAGNGKRHRQRQGKHPHGDACPNILTRLRTGIIMQTIQ